MCMFMGHAVGGMLDSWRARESTWCGTCWSGGGEDWRTQHKAARLRREGRRVVDSRSMSG